MLTVEDIVNSIMASECVMCEHIDHRDCTGKDLRAVDCRKCITQAVNEMKGIKNYETGTDT